MYVANGVDMLIQGEWPEYVAQMAIFKVYLPELYYVYPETGARFASEAALFWWMENL